MKLTGPACTEALNEAEEARRRERAGDSAGGVRVERRVRRMSKGFVSSQNGCNGPIIHRRNHAPDWARPKTGTFCGDTAVVMTPFFQTAYVQPEAP